MILSALHPSRAPATAQPESPRRSATLELVRALYPRAPHATLCRPFCKARPALRECSYLASTDGQRLSAVVAYTGDSVEFTWARAGRVETLRNLIVQVRRRVKALSFLPVMETESFNWNESLRLDPRGRFFRALFSGQRTGEANLPHNLTFSSFDPAHDTQAALDLLGSGTASTAILFNPGHLRTLTATDNFYPDGWIWVRDRVSRRPIGLAINGYCPEFEEGYVDWIQVLPEFRRRGIGTALLHESIHRLEHARFVTVSGSLDPPHAAGDLYARCGFGQTRRWTVWGNTDATRVP